MVTNYRAISEPALIELLASPVRQELADTLAAMGGEATAAALAEQLGRHADGLYYHLKKLCAAGLLQVIGKEGEEQRYRLAGKGAAPLRLAYQLGFGGNAPAVRKFVHGLLQVAEQDVDQALELPSVTVSGPQRQLWAARNKSWLSSSDLVEVNILLERLCALTSQPRAPGRDQLMSCAFVLAPVLPRPKRRSQDE
ncbi:helix-turn-helix transcriptional regulator [Oxalobacteraceae bacterium]|nr:helix-turn-helix transcriptional regulator [Oxalobacteraceae bacterium]